jgi:autotransporter-associated beta strand protein
LTPLVHSSPLRTENRIHGHGQTQDSPGVPVRHRGRPRQAGRAPFYQKLNQLLADHEFDPWLERRCAQYYEQVETRGRPSLPPGVYFRKLLVGYFEDLDSQRGIAWRCADSVSLRAFLGIPLDQSTPDHSTLTNTRKRLPKDVFDDVFQFVLEIAEAKQLIAGTTVGVDSTRLEAITAMKSIVRRDTGETWHEYVRGLMRAEGVIDPDDQPTAEEVRRFDRKRKDKQVRNDHWQSPSDPDAEIAKMKDGTTHRAYKVEHVVDLESDLIVAAELRKATAADSATLAESVLAAQHNLSECGSGEFTSADIDAIKSIGTTAGGFTNGSAIGLDTTNAGGTFTYSTIIANTNLGANSIGVAKLGTGVLELSGANSYTGNTTLVAGTLKVGSAQTTTTGPLGGGTGSLPTGTIIFAGGALQFSSVNTVDYSSKIADTAFPMMLDTNGQAVTFASVLGVGKTAGLTKLGTGMLKLTAANLFTGTTTINAGTLEIGVANALPSNAITIAGSGSILSSGATTGFSDSLGTLKVTGTTSTISLGTGSHTLTFAGFDNTGFTSLTITGWTGSAGSSGTGGKLVFTDTSGFTAGNLANINFSGYNPGAVLVGNELVPAPEPGPIFAIGAAALGFGYIRRRRHLQT